MNLEQWQRSKKIKAEAEAAAKRTIERVLNAVKEPAMSEFKEYKIRVNETESKVAQELFFKLGYKWPFTGQHVVWLSKPWLSTGITGQIYWHEENQSEDFYRCKLITLEQLGELAGHRIDESVDQMFKDAIEHGNDLAMVSIEGVEHVSIAQVIKPFPCEELGDDSHIENHISPLCKSKDV
ncbi:hypothetical protein J540_3242 [Acinetobacter baumannii 1440422]|nr:hypothetical protein J540_3242 [Acinetobacter baumannii 1440422]